MTSASRILGTLRAVDGTGAVRMEDRYDTGIEDLWASITDPERLARWYGEIEGDLRLGGEYRARLFASGWEGSGRIEVGEPPAAPGRDGRGAGRAGGRHRGHADRRWRPDDPGPRGAGHAAGVRRRLRVEDLAAYLAGGERCDSDARMAELFPDYEVMPVGAGGGQR
jgi:hypothetical protein